MIAAPGSALGDGASCDLVRKVPDGGVNQVGRMASLMVLGCSVSQMARLLCYALVKVVLSLVHGRIKAANWKAMTLAIVPPSTPR